MCKIHNANWLVTKQQRKLKFGAFAERIGVFVILGFLWPLGHLTLIHVSQSTRYSGPVLDLVFCIFNQQYILQNEDMGL